MLLRLAFLPRRIFVITLRKEVSFDSEVTRVAIGFLPAFAALEESVFAV